MHRITPSEFAAKWEGSTRTERAASQEHFIDLCRMLEVPTPNEADSKGTWYAFEKGTEKLDGGDGYADVWKKNHFAWEYKGKHKNLKEAYRQLLQYRESLENPPLLVVCDLDRFEVHTNFTNSTKVVYAFSLASLKADPAEPLRVLRAVMREPEALRPSQTREQITESAASQFALLAGRLQKRGHDPHEVAHFLNRILFCLFAEDTELLPKGLIGRIIDSTKGQPAKAAKLIKDLFEKMSSKGGGHFGAEEIQWFNGGLFDDDKTLPLEEEDLQLIKKVSILDWSSVEPAILGTLFERGLDPSKRSQLGAHYTDKDSIMRVIEPVILAPLRREFDAMRDRVTRLVARGKRATARAKGIDNPNRVFRAYLDRLRSIRVLDPACGSGNFLYLTLRAIKDLEKEAIIWGAQALQTSQELPGVGPQIVRGIELNEYAAELARVTVWIGEIQWMIANGFGYLRNPVLRPIETIECRDGILVRPKKGPPTRADWPDAEFVVGNPPFLGGKKLRGELGDSYIKDLFGAWQEHVPPEADLVTYWHEKAREMIEEGRSKRAGLLATQGIRGGANLQILKKIKDSGDIFLAWSDEPWVVEGASVRVSIVGQDDGSEEERTLDGTAVDVIHADLTGGRAGVVDLTTARRLKENLGISFMGDTKGGAFDISEEDAREMLSAPVNVNGKSNSEVIVPWVNGLDLARRARRKYIIDFGIRMEKSEAQKYELPFQYVEKNVKKKRLENKRQSYRDWYWIHVEPRPALRQAIQPLKRFIATPRNGRQRLFVWQAPPVLPDCQVIVVARDDWYTFGVLNARPHEVWSLRKGTKLGKGNDPRYTPTTTFETYPFPWPLDLPDKDLTKKQVKQRDDIAAAAESLDDLRMKWLNPADLVTLAPPFINGFPKRLIPKSPKAEKQLKSRTLSALYGSPPEWLITAQDRLDRAVLTAYGIEGKPDDEALLKLLLMLNQKRSPADTPSEDEDEDQDED